MTVEIMVQLITKYHKHATTINRLTFMSNIMNMNRNKMFLMISQEVSINDCREAKSEFPPVKL